LSARAGYLHQSRLNNLAQLLHATNRVAEAEPLIRRALAIDESSYGEDHPVVARDLNRLAELLQATSRLSEASSLYQRALQILAASLGDEHPSTRTVTTNLATLLRGKAEAENELTRPKDVPRGDHWPNDRRGPT
jgi:tetratricopeptide (TPR) repeat protein